MDKIFIVGGLTIGLIIGKIQGQEHTRREAVKVGVATYVNAQDGTAEFQWITNE